MRIAFIGFGEAGRAFAETLRGREGITIAAFDRLDTDEMAEAMAGRAVRWGTDPEDVMRGANWIISAVTADQSLEAALAAAPHLVQGQAFLDINSVSPGRKRETAAVVEAAGGRYVDMAVMAPVHPRGHATPVLVAGRAIAGLVPDLSEAGFDLDVAGHEPGQATAVKMVRSLFVKGLEAITVETALAAEASGCYERVVSSLARSYPGLDWPQNATYNFERTSRHGARRAAEMRESGVTLDGLGLNGALAREIAAIQDRMGALPIEGEPDADPQETAAAVLRAIARG